MLVLARKNQETICIYPDGALGQEETLIEVKILLIQDTWVKVGIQAAKNIRVQRREIYDALLDGRG